MKKASMTSAERIQRVKDRLQAADEIYKNVDYLELCISDGNEKIGWIKNVSVSPIDTCHGVCGTCAAHCYDAKSVIQYDDTAAARARNTRILRNHPFEFFAQALSAARRQRKGLFRWNVGGEIDSVAHFQIIARIAQLVPGTRFLLFTKRHYLVNSYIEKYGMIPSNLKLIFSAWPGMALDNPYGFPVSAPYAGEKPSGWIECMGNCESCAKAKKANTGCWNATPGSVIGFRYHGTEEEAFTETFRAWEGIQGKEAVTA